MPHYVSFLRVDTDSAKAYVPNQYVKFRLLLHQLLTLAVKIKCLSWRCRSVSTIVGLCMAWFDGGADSRSSMETTLSPSQPALRTRVCTAQEVSTLAMNLSGTVLIT